MTPEDKERFIRAKADEHLIGETEKIMWSLHAVRKLRVEGLRKRAVEEALSRCVLIEDYVTAGRPLPACLVLGFRDGSPLHVVVAIDEAWDRMVYRPDQKRRQNDWRKRKREE